MSEDNAAPSRAPQATVSAPHDGAATRIEAIETIIRNGLSNGPISQTEAAWEHLQTRLGEIARAILEEV